MLKSTFSTKLAKMPRKSGAKPDEPKEDDVQYFQGKKSVPVFKVVLVLEGVQTLKHLAINLLEQTMTVMKSTLTGFVVEKVFPETHLLQIETDMFNQKRIAMQLDYTEKNDAKRKSRLNTSETEHKKIWCDIIFSSVFKTFQFMQFIETIKWRASDDIRKLLVSTKIKRGFTQNDAVEKKSKSEMVQRHDSIIEHKKQFDNMMLSGEQRDR